MTSGREERSPLKKKKKKKKKKSWELEAYLAVERGDAC